MAKSKFDEAQAAAKSIADLVREHALRAISDHDQQLAAEYDTIAAGIRADLQAVGYTIPQVREIVEKHIARSSAARRKVIEESIIAAAREARVLPQAQFDAIFGREVGPEAAAPFGRASAAKLKPLRRRVPGSEGGPQSTG